MLPIAFAGCNDPYSWVIRGLLDYGWEDISLEPSSYPKQSGKGFDLRHLIDPISKFGIRLVVLSIDAEGKWYRRDESYEFEARYVQNLRKEDCILLRSDEMAFSQLFPIVPEQPIYSAGYIHEAIQKQVPIFVERRKMREMISSIELQEMLNFPLLSAPQNLLQFIAQRLQYGENFNRFHPWRQAPVQQQAQQSTQQQAQQPTQQNYIPQQQPINTPQNTQPINWAINEGMDRGQLLRSNQGMFSQEHSSAVVIVEKAAQALKITAGAAIFLGVLAVVNALFTSYMVSAQTTVRNPDSYMPVIILSFLIGFIGIIGGWLSWYSNRFYREVENKPLFWAPIIFSALYPLTFVIGIPSAIFALIKWRDPTVQRILKQ